eukprot:362288-Chlamydomonas_euryale.AAC.1
MLKHMCVRRGVVCSVSCSACASSPPCRKCGERGEGSKGEKCEPAAIALARAGWHASQKPCAGGGAEGRASKRCATKFS